jgi:corrinoid protein of di/trimethylamine methyltransferase
MEDLKMLYEAIVEGDARTTLALTKQALANNISPESLISGFMIPAMDEVGKRFESEEYYVPELLLSGRAMKGALEVLRPLLAASGAEPVGRVVIGTVKGDLHDIGKNLVAAMLEGAGFEVTDLGTDVSPERFVEAIATEGASIVCLSALLTVTMPAMQTVLEALKAAGVRDKVRVMIGGAPVTEQYAREIGADSYSENASGAVATARRLAGEVPRA